MSKDKILAPKYFNHYFKMGIKPNLETLIKLTDYFNIRIDKFVGRV